ncbi:hypothetical protein GCM10028819_49670 [Spirosoma humi]
MKHAGYCIRIFLCLLTIGALGQSTNYSSKPYALYNGLTYQSVHFFNDKQQGWLVGDLATLLHTVNGGRTWQQVDIPVQNNYLQGIHFHSDERTGWITGGLGTILLTKDGGKTWTKPDYIPSKNNINNIYFTKNLRYGIAVGDKGTVLLSRDGGKTWVENKTVDSNEELWGGEISEDGQRLWAYGNTMTMLVSRDGGKTWVDKFPSSISSTLKDPNIYSMVFDANQQIGYAVCEWGYILKTYDSGQKWQRQKIDKVEYLRSVCFSPDMKLGWTVSSEGQIFQTKDSGKNWLQTHQTRDSTSLRSVWFSQDQKTGYITGKNGFIMNTNDSGKTWHYRVTPTFNITEFQLDKYGRLIAATDKGIFMKSRNLNFVRISPAKFTISLNGMDLTNNTGRVWAVGEQNTIVSCNTDGSDWAVMYQNKDEGHLNSIEINQNLNFGVAIGSLGKVLISHDEGKTWKVKPIVDEKIAFSDVYLKKTSGEGWIVGDQGSLYYTADIGNTWERLPFSDSTQFLISIDFEKNSKIGYIATTSNKTEKHLYTTVDGGHHWGLVENFPENSGLQHVAINSVNGETIVTAINGNIYRTIDRGRTWLLNEPRLTWQRLTYTQFDKHNNVIITGSGGTILIGGKRGSSPIISSVFLRDSSEHIVPSLQANDPDTPPTKLGITMSIQKGDLPEWVDKKYQFYNARYNAPIQALPAAIFKLNKAYTLRFAVSDGWNIAYKDTTIRISEPWWSEFKKFMYWHELPKDGPTIIKAVTTNISGLGFLYAAVILGLFAVSPIHYIRWHEAVSNSRIPSPEKLSKYLVLFLIEHDRCLDTFVAYYRRRSLELFTASKDVNSRPYWVPAPFEIDNQKILGFQPDQLGNYYTPGLPEIRRYLRPDRILVSIEGQGGVGKSSLAFQLARWATETDPRRRLFPHMALPIFANTIDAPLDTICTNRLAYLTNNPKLSETLSGALLRKKRVVVIVDGLSEYADLKQEFIHPDTGAKNAYCVIYTSRKPIALPESTVIVPSGLRIEFLDNLLDGFTNSYAGAYKFGEQREVLRSKVKRMILELNGMDNEKPVPLSILRIIVEKASAMIDQQEDLANLPNSISHLLDNYVADLFRSHADPDAAVRQLRKAALISLGMGQLLSPISKKSWSFISKWNCRPQWTPDTVYSAYLDKGFLVSCRESGLMTTSGNVGDKQLKFTHDPIAEYLTAKELIIKIRDQKIDADLLKRLVVIIEKSNQSLYNALTLLSSQMDVCIL